MDAGTTRGYQPQEEVDCQPRRIKDHHVCITYNKAQEDIADWLSNQLERNQYKVTRADDGGKETLAVLAKHQKIVMVLSKAYIGSKKFEEEIEHIKSLTKECLEEILIPVLCDGLKYEDLPLELQRGNAVPCIGRTEEYPVVGDEIYWKSVIVRIDKICSLFWQNGNELGCYKHMRDSPGEDRQDDSGNPEIHQMEQLLDALEVRPTGSSAKVNSKGGAPAGQLDSSDHKIVGSQSQTSLGGLESHYKKNFCHMEELGRGGFGVVYKAQHLHDEQYYAVKCICVEKSELAKKDARREVTALAKMNHKNIVRYFSTWFEDCCPLADDGGGFESSFCSDSGDGCESSKSSSIDCQKDHVYLYIQMELCQRSTLADWLLDNRDCDKVLMWFGQMVDAVRYIHFLKLIHRDLKPANIFLSQDGSLKIGDFGLVKAEEHSSGGKNAKTHTPYVGSELYQSPEQRSKKTSYSQKMDIYALGVIFIEMISSFGSGTERGVELTRLRDTKEEFLEDFKEDHEKEAEFVVSLLATDPKERPAADQILKHHLFENQ